MNVGLARTKIMSKSKGAGDIPFMFAYKLVAGPLLFRRDVFLAGKGALDESTLLYLS